MRKSIVKGISTLALSGLLVFPFVNTAEAASNYKPLTIPGGKGKITSNVWKSGLTKSGNTYLFDYQVSAVYSGTYSVSEIRTTFTVGASLRNSATMNIGVESGGASAGSGSSWQNVSKTAYWANTKGQKTSSWRSNASIAPHIDYRSGTYYVKNTARVKLTSDKKPYEITISV